jgi:hypothetical protein
MHWKRIMMKDHIILHYRREPRFIGFLMIMGKGNKEMVLCELEGHLIILVLTRAIKISIKLVYFLLIHD